MSVMGLDIGTTGCKTVVFDETGTILAQAYREYPLLHPLSDRSEIDVFLLWNRISEELLEVNLQVKADPVVALAVSCQGEAVVPVGSDGQPLDNFVVTFDNRTLEQVKQWEETASSQTIFEITGMPLHPMYSVNKMMWFKNHKPALFKKVWKFLCVEDYIIHRLGLTPSIDYSLAARTMAFDIRKKEWSDQMLTWAGIDRDLLARVVPSGTCVGEMDSKIATELGFRPKVKVVTGGHDQPCGALGAGIIQPGIAMNAIGTSDVVCPAFAQPILSRQMR
jgi:xylulokinase